MRCSSNHKPTNTIDAPATTPIVFANWSARTYSVKYSVAIPRANTLTVCVNVTTAPSNSACRNVPRLPTRYAATIVFPWPGENACTAPNPNATANAASHNPAPISP